MQSAANRTFVLVKHSLPVAGPDVQPNRWAPSDEGRGPGIATSIPIETWRLLGLPSYAFLALPDFGLLDIATDIT